VNNIRFRYSIRLGLFASIFAPVGAALGIWLAHRLTTTGGVAEMSVLICVECSIQLLAYSIGKRFLPLLPSRNSTITPPLNAEFLFYLFLTPQNCDALLGDLEERYKVIHKKFGRRRASFWYWTHTVMSLGPIVWAWSKKVSLKPVVAIVTWAVAKDLLGHDSWLAALVELWKRVRS
jgi:hypothetical protein